MPTPEPEWHIYQPVMDSRPFAFRGNFNENLELLRMTEYIKGKVIFST
ncbi:hypothetical protein [uncultured Imperialibacter sp.]